MADSINYQDWIDRAEQDMRVLKILKKNGFEDMEDSICYNCHQAAEKLLKAFLLLKENKLIKTHDLVYLLNQCSRFDHQFNGFQEPITVLNQYALSARYPGDFSGSRSLEEAMEAFTHLEEFYSFISSKFI
jgi:HEPN domain-containing protein